MFFFCIQKTNASVLNIFISCFVCFLVILCYRGWKMKYFLFPDNDFGTTAFLFGQSCLCVTFTLWSTPSFGMLLSKLSNRNTRVHPVSEWSAFFLPFSVNCSQVAMLQIICQSCVCTDRGREVQTSFMDDPLQYLIKNYKLWYNCIYIIV